MSGTILNTGQDKNGGNGELTPQTVANKEVDIASLSCKERCIHKSWQWIERYLDSTKVKLKQKADLAVKLAMKDMPEQTTASKDLEEVVKKIKDNLTIEELRNLARPTNRITESLS